VRGGRDSLAAGGCEMTSYGESSYFFGLVSDQAPVLRTVWVHLDSGWVSMNVYARRCKPSHDYGCAGNRASVVIVASA
jgi:hypothetical protein